MTRRRGAFFLISGGLLAVLILVRVAQPDAPMPPAQVRGVSAHPSWNEPDLIGETKEQGQRQFWGIDLESQNLQPMGSGMAIEQVRRSGKATFWVRSNPPVKELVASNEVGDEAILTVSLTDIQIEDVAPNGQGVLYAEGNEKQMVLYWRDIQGQTRRLGPENARGVFSDRGERILYWARPPDSSFTTMTEAVGGSPRAVEDRVVGDFGDILNVTATEFGVWLIDRVDRDERMFGRLFHRSSSSEGFEKQQEWREPFENIVIPAVIEISGSNQIFFQREDATGYSEVWSFDRSASTLRRILRGGFGLTLESRSKEIFYLRNEANDASQPGQLQHLNPESSIDSVLPFAQPFHSLSR